MIHLRPRPSSVSSAGARRAQPPSKGRWAIRWVRPVCSTAWSRSRPAGSASYRPHGLTEAHWRKASTWLSAVQAGLRRAGRFWSIAAVSAGTTSRLFSQPRDSCAMTMQLYCLIESAFGPSARGELGAHAGDPAPLEDPGDGNLATDARLTVIEQAGVRFGASIPSQACWGSVRRDGVW